jgi:membrane protein implicated in regulation of membrane protease activity
MISLLMILPWFSGAVFLALVVLSQSVARPLTRRNGAATEGDALF